MMDQLPVELLSYGPTGILALAMLSTIGLFWRSQRSLASSVGHTREALKLAEAKNERIQVLVDVIQRNTDALAGVKEAVHATAEAVRHMNGRR